MSNETINFYVNFLYDFVFLILLLNYYAVAASNFTECSRKEAMVAKTGVPVLLLIIFL
jgi:hypothetical protein